MAKMKEEYKRLRSEANVRYWDSHRAPRVQKNGYVTICVGNKKRYLHRVIMEQIIGRPLLPGEVVHHLNGDKTDNRPENLRLMSDHEHRKQHAIESGLGHHRRG